MADSVRDGFCMLHTPGVVGSRFYVKSSQKDTRSLLSTRKISNYQTGFGKDFLCYDDKAAEV